MNYRFNIKGILNFKAFIRYFCVTKTIFLVLLSMWHKAHKMKKVFY